MRGRGYILGLLLLAPTAARAQADHRPSLAPRLTETATETQAGLPPMVVECRGSEGFGGTKVERAAFCAVMSNQLVSGRTLAERALVEGPDSFRAHYLMGYAQHLGEANLPKALFHLEAAEAGFVREFGAKPDHDKSPWRVFYRILVELLSVHGEMDHHQAKIEYADKLTEGLDISFEPRKAWPLLKLERFEEARRIAKKAAESDDDWERAVGLTGLCAVESELRNRQAAYEACVAAARRVLRAPPDGAVELSNAGAASEEMFAFDEAERYYLEATRRNAEGSVNPWGRLVRLYLRQGRFAEALSAWRQMRAYRAARAGAHMDQQDQSEADLIGASVLLVAGRADDAAPITHRTVSRPDRQGTSSAASEQNEAGAAVMDRVAKLAAARLLEEEAVSAGLSEAIRLRARAAELRYEAWRSGRAAAEVLADPERLYTTLRPECPGSLELPSWLDAEVIALVGPGVALAAIEVARAQETLPEALSAPIFEAFEAEARWRAGDSAEALGLAEGVLAKLAASEGLHRARAAAVAAEAAREEGQTRRALGHYAEVLSRDPALIRRLGLRLPVRLVGLDDDPEVEDALDALEDSPRFDAEPWGFELQVGLRVVRIVSAEGTVLAEAEVPDEPPAPQGDADAETSAAEPEAAAVRIARAVHRDLLAPQIDITQSDVRSLDGSLGTGGRASQRVRSVLEEVQAP